jgi:hypothetical protein
MGGGVLDFMQPQFSSREHPVVLANSQLVNKMPPSALAFLVMIWPRFMTATPFHGLNCRFPSGWNA